MHSSTHRSERTRCLWFTKGLGRGGVERLLVDMLPLIDTGRFTVDVAYVLPWKKDYHSTLEQLGASVYCLGSAYGAKDLRWLLRLRRLLVDGGYDVIHTHAPIPATAARMVSGRRPPAIVHTEHNVWDRYRTPTRILNSLTYWRNAAVIAVSNVVGQSIQPWPVVPQSSIRTVHHGTALDSVRTYNAQDRRDRRSQEGLSPDAFLIGNVGNFTAKKDHRNLLNTLTGKGPISQAELVLVGLGPLEDELRRVARDLGVANRVTFLGSRSDVFELLPLFDLFCLSSEFEGFPIALVEAMASGVACVATNVGGIPEIVIDGKNGLLVPSQDSAALRQALERAMSDDDLRLRLGVQARTTASGLDLGNAVDELQRVYDDALRVAS